MKKTRYTGLLFAVMAIVMLAGCSNEVDNAIKKLGGTEQDQQEAREIISMSVDDPLPRLTKALSNKKLSALTRKNVALMIGSTCERIGEEEIKESPAPAMTAALKGAEDEVKEAIVDALGRIPGGESLKALQGLLDSKDKVVAEAATRVLNEKAKKLEAKANELSGAAMERKIELMEQAVEINPRNVELAQKLAASYEVQGDTEKAREVFSAGGKYVTALKVIGPFPGTAKEEFVNPAKFNFSSAVTAGGEKLKWFNFKDVPENGFVDFRKSFDTKVSKSIYYAAFNLDASSDQEVLMKVNCRTSEMTIWAGGKQVFVSTPKDAKEKGEQEVALGLKSGKTPVLVKLKSRKYARFSIRISDKNHNKTDAVKYSL